MTTTRDRPSSSQPAADYTGPLLEVDNLHVEFRLRHSDGSWRWYRDSTAILERTTSGQPRQLIGARLDITELKEQQAAILLTVSSRTLQSWRSDGLGPPFLRVGRSVRYRLGDLLAWMAENTVRSRRRK